jgi:hypothetical protein
LFFKSLCEGGTPKLPADVQRMTQWLGVLDCRPLPMCVHRFFFLCAGVRVRTELLQLHFSGLEEFKEKWLQAARALHGSGWIYLVVTPNGEVLIRVCSSSSAGVRNHPLTELSQVPVLCMDLWEHAYYGRYEPQSGQSGRSSQDRLSQYVEDFFGTVDWRIVGKRIESSVGIQRLLDRRSLQRLQEENRAEEKRKSLNAGQNPSAGVGNARTA